MLSHRQALLNSKEPLTAYVHSLRMQSIKRFRAPPASTTAKSQHWNVMRRRSYVMCAWYLTHLIESPGAVVA
jgi:hypothetical protein